jgi:hypothetical protein
MRIFKSKCGLPTVTEQVELSETNSAHEAQVNADNINTSKLVFSPNMASLYSSMIGVQVVAICEKPLVFGPLGFTCTDFADISILHSRLYPLLYSSHCLGLLYIFFPTYLLHQLLYILLGILSSSQVLSSLRRQFASSRLSFGLPTLVLIPYLLHFYKMSLIFFPDGAMLLLGVFNFFFLVATLL